LRAAIIADSSVADSAVGSIIFTFVSSGTPKATPGTMPPVP
jgi:hypothetical protein